MRRVLLIDRPGKDGAALAVELRRRGFEVRIEDSQWRAAEELCRPVPVWEFVVLVTRTTSEEDVKLLRELVMASQRAHQGGLPEFIFVSCSRCVPSFRVRIGRLGARYVRL